MAVISSRSNEITAILNEVQQQAEQYMLYTTIKGIANQRDKTPLSEQWIAQSIQIDLHSEDALIQRIAAQTNSTKKELSQKILLAKTVYHQKLYTQLKKEYPILAEYNSLLCERIRKTGYRGEQLDKALFIKARGIISNTVLYDRLQRAVPIFSVSLTVRVKERGNDRNLER